jgi:CheY-like chemotaxis protein
MGFDNVSILTKGADVIDLAQDDGIDLLITEWNTASMSGLELSRLLRKPEYNPNIMMPIMMTTARAEMADVKAARDSGLSEFIAKPFSSRSLFARLKRSIDNPPDFVVSENFVGPDRRRRGTPPAGMRDMRHQEPVKLNGLQEGRRNGVPYIMPNDKRLRKRANLVLPLDKIITEEVLLASQQAIDAFRGESVQWIGADLMRLEEAVRRLLHSPEAAEETAQQLLALKSRAGTFGYENAVQVIFEFYQFMRHYFDLQYEVHFKLALRYIDVLKVLLAPDAAGYDATMQKMLMDELSKMTRKVRQAHW